MPKENNKVDINKHEIDIDTLFKQNVNDLSAIKELYRKLDKVEEKISQIKYNDSTLAYKLKKEYEKLKKIILDENVQLQLNNKIEETKNIQVELNNKIEEISSQMEHNVRELKNSKVSKVELDIERKRIDSFTSLTEGSTTGDAELIDGRIGADGIVYSNIGDANRSQFAALEEKITMLDEVTEIKYRNINNSEMEVGNLSSNGEVVADNNYLRTKSFIKVVGGKTIYLKKLTGANVYDIFEYDKQYNFIKTTKNIYDYAQTNYTRTLQLSDNTKYIKFKAWWTDSITDVKIAVYYDGCGIRDYEDYTEPKPIVKSSSIDVSSNIPVICFNFDEINLDNRFTTLQSVGFTATWQFTKDTLLYSKDIINTLIQNGHDISPYYGLSDIDYKDTENHSTNITKMKEEVTKILNDMKKLGIYNPVMFSCSRHRGGYVVNEAIKDLKFKYIRCTWGVDQQGNDYYVSNLNGSDKKEQCPLPLTYYNTFETVKTAINDRISNGASLIMIMCHSLSYDNITESNYFENLVSYIKTLSDKDIVKVMNMKEYYEYHYPIQAEKDDRIRIMSNINDIKNLHLT